MYFIDKDNNKRAFDNVNPCFYNYYAVKLCAKTGFVSN